MSGIAGIIRLDGAPVTTADLQAMLAPMQRRGPDRSHWICVGNAGFGQVLLATTPEALAETQPWVHPDSGCVVVSDSRLDNRPELLRALGMGDRDADAVGDGELLHAAYQQWGVDCADHLRGDFAFAIRDPHKQTLLCARDIMGVRPFYFHHAPGKLFAFASDTDALLALPDVPLRINEGRIADALVAELEGIDRSSTFYLDIFRLPPARTLELACGQAVQVEYWQPLRDKPANLPATDAQWSRSLREILMESVRARLRGAGPIGAMLSGGLDSSSVAALGQQILSAQARGPLATISAINSEGACAETAAVRSMLAAFGFDATTIDLQALGDLPLAVCAQLGALREPFDASMTLISAVYAAAAAKGIRGVLDGIPADNLYTAGPYLQRLARRGRLLRAWREARALHRFEMLKHPGLRAWQTLAGCFAPACVRRLWSLHQERVFYRRELLPLSLISLPFARRVDLWQRLRAYRKDMADTRLEDASGQAHTIMTVAYITAGIERYNRVASFHGIEPRHPFLDRRVIEFHAWMPLHLRLRDGRYKWALRHAMGDVLPADIAWRRGKEHLGHLFNRSLHPLREAEARTANAIDQTTGILSNDAIDWHKLPASQPAAGAMQAGLPQAAASARAVIDWAGRSLGLGRRP